MLHFKIIQQIEVGIKIVILFQRLQITHRRTRLRRIYDRDHVIR